MKALIIAHYADSVRGLELAKKLPGKCERRFAKAVLLARMSKVNDAIYLFSDDLCEKFLPYFFREKGRFYFKLGRLSEALSYLNKAIEHNKNDYYALYFRGRIYSDLKKVSLALNDLYKVLDYVPYDSEIHTVLGRVEGRYKGAFYGYLHYAYAELYKGNKALMTKYYNRAKKLAVSNEQKKLLKEFEAKYKEWKKYW